MNQQRKPSKRQGPSARQSRAVKTASTGSVVSAADSPASRGDGQAQVTAVKTPPQKSPSKDAQQRHGAQKPASSGSASKAKPEADDDDSVFDRIMEQAALPGRFVTYVLVLILVVVGWLWPKYVVDPTSVGGSVHDWITAAISVLLFLSFSTLTILAYSLLFGGPSETNKKFVAAVLSRAGIGATFGALLGVRLAPALLGQGPGTGASFPGYLGDVGDTITLLTLVLISTLWPHSLGTLMRTVTGAPDRDPRVPDRLRKWVVLAVVLVANYLGVMIAIAVYGGLSRR